MKKILTYYKNRKGITIVMIALMLFVLLAFLGLAVDISYMYFVKNQLQVAADAAALAGVKKLNGDTDDTAQPDARNEAITFASKNKAAGVAVELASNGDNVLSSINDITVGNWDPNLTPKYLAGRTPVNAVEVRPQRVAGLLGNRDHVKVFLGKVFGWKFLSAGAIAAAAMPMRANNHFTMCDDACNAIYPLFDTSVRSIDTPNIGDPFRQLAWTSLLESPASAVTVRKLMCAHSDFANVCNKQIYTNPDADAFRNLASVFLDPGTPKTECIPIPGINCPPGGTGWWVIVPIASATACGSDLINASTPKTVIKYAFIRIIRVCATGLSSGGCPDRPALPGPPRLPGCLPGTSTSVVVDRFSCINCALMNDFLGLRSFLVK